MSKKQIVKHVLLIASIFIISFFLGEGIAALQAHFFPTVRLTSTTGSWGLSFQQNGETPIGNASSEELASFDSYYAKDTKNKVIYLTFDAGYENGNTKPILDALKKHNAPATFFVVGTYLKENADIVNQIISDGHIIGNHTYHHKDMSQLSSQETFSEELLSVENLYKEITGKNMIKFYRPPQGSYSTTNLQMAKNLGYKTFFWSLAYVDWYQDKQPTHDEAFDKLIGRIHPGAIVLLHSTSSTNAEILDDLLSKWEEMGYSFGSLEDF